MPEAELQWLDVYQRRIAYLATPPAAPGGTSLLWLAGLKSDMASTKATALARFAAAQGLGLTRFDYSGHGRSQGRLVDATIGDWLEEARAIFLRATSGPQVLVGSSTGGYVALLVLRRLMGLNPEEARRIKALVLIAPAWDLTEKLMWDKFSPEVRGEIMDKGVAAVPSQYGEPYAITRRFIEEGRLHLLAGSRFDPGRPVLVLQGRLDPDVPVEHVRALSAILEGDRLRIKEVADGDHRLSRDEDIARLFRLVNQAVAT